MNFSIVKRFSGIKIPKYVTSWVAQRQLPDFIEKLYHATLRYAETKMSLKWGKNRDPGFEYPSDHRLDDFNGEDENMEDNVNKLKRCEQRSPVEEASAEESEEAPKPSSKSWWSYLLFYNYLH
jgi:hypothetical protein